MCEICNKQCYQTALINDNLKEEVTGLCYEIDPKCDKNNRH